MTSQTGTREWFVSGRPTRLRTLIGPTINLAEQEGRDVRPSAAASVVVAIDKLLRHKQYVHVVATGLMCNPPSAPRVEICDHLTPSAWGFTSSLRVAETAPACAERPRRWRRASGLRA